MSADEDTELRDLVAQALESNGVLGKIKAELRANVFLALEDQESVHTKAPFQNTELRQFLGSKDGRIVASLVREFLEYFHLDFTLAVFEPESGSGEHYQGRNNLAKDLGVAEPESGQSLPLLAELLKHSKVKGHATEATFSFPNTSPDENKNTQKTKNTDLSQANSTNSDSLSKQNQKNLDTSKLTQRPPPPLPKSAGNDVANSKDDDSFFDDPIPSLSEHSRSLTSDKSKKEGKQSTSVGFLDGAPPLNKAEPRPASDTSGFRDKEKTLADVEIPLDNLDDYDDDFESSNVSPVGQTPRSARSDHNIKSIDEEIDEDIEEDLSVAEDLLHSDNSGMDDMTTDRTVSPTEQSTAFDYAEDVHLP